MTRGIPANLIEQAAELIVTTRDFCGDEREAVFEFAAEHGWRTEHVRLHKLANFRANAIWNRCQKAAGVNPKYTW